MVAQQQFDHSFARLTHFIAVGLNDHALGHHRGAGGLKLGHLLDFDNAHTASALQRESGVIAKRGHLDAHGLAGLDQQRPSGSREFLSVDRKRYVRHKNSELLIFAASNLYFVTLTASVLLHHSQSEQYRYNE